MLEPLAVESACNTVKLGNQDSPTSCEAILCRKGEEKNDWGTIWPVMACGAGLFSDGYINNVYKSFSSLPTS